MMLVLGMIVVSFSTFIMVLISPMVTDSCSGDSCDMDTIGIAWTTMILSVPVTFLVVIAGIIWAAIKRWFMFIWPLLGCVVIGAVTLIAVQVMEGAAGL
ncbi:hypothetical protein [Tomitella biformata]|uniref:hypothetical protein n=1 Tax=Tomitella biformata TaxID=630403 RepID=UPI0011DCAFC0|nr:hypothetical protein [Tomitella biformata]